MSDIADIAKRVWRHFCATAVTLVLFAGLAGAQELSREEAATRVEPPYQLGKQTAPGQWLLDNLDGRVAGYAFETKLLAPLLGFAGAPINLFVSISLEGRFIDAEIISHNEPIFVSGLGNAAFHKFVAQYRGRTIFDTLVVGVPYGDKDKGSSLVYLDGVTKATASVRIAHETILAAAFAVARDRIKGVAGGPPARPDLAHDETLTWQDLVESGIARRRLVTNREVDDTFKETLWSDDDPEAKTDPGGAYLDLWVVDVGPPAVARAVLTPESVAVLDRFRELSPHDEPILVIDAGRHGLVSEDFVRNTSPDLISAEQHGLPVALRDADLEVDLKPGIPGNVAMILRTDRRLGFDPTREWTISVRAVREHGQFKPEVGSVDFSLAYAAPERFFLRDTVGKPAPPWRQALQNRQFDLVVLAASLAGLIWLLWTRQSWLAARRHYTAIRLAILFVVMGFVGWWGQGQLSIVTVLGVVRGVADQQSLAFLLYDPFSLVIWAVVLVTFIAWGRGFFCGWMCPFGAMQEFAHHAGRWLRLPRLTIPQRWDLRLVKVKYLVLTGLLASTFLAPGWNDLLAEVEPFKTAITVYFVREWYFVAYAVFWLLLGMVFFKGFCRYVCPLGAFMALGGLLRQRDWIARRTDCGSPCQLCRVRCNYNAITSSGKIEYDECFQCLDCVTIHDDARQCVPLVLAARRTAR